MLRRRRHKRLLNLDNIISVRYKFGLRFYKKDAISVGNVSGGGISLCLPERLKPGTIIDIEIKLTDSKEVLPAKGKVVWSHKLEDKSYPKACFRTGVVFIDIDPLSICKIYTYFHEHNLTIRLT